MIKMAEHKISTEKKVSTKDYFENKAVEAKKRLEEGKPLEKVNIEDKVKVRFTKDYGYMKKGQEATISIVAYNIYNENKCIEKID